MYGAASAAMLSSDAARLIARAIFVKNKRPKDIFTSLGLLQILVAREANEL